MSDDFKKYLDSNNTEYKCKEIALTSKSYKHIYEQENKKQLSNFQDNSEMATYGDALLKFALCKILFEENVKNITEAKKNYECDEVLVKIVAEHYGLLSDIHCDRDDDNIPKDYDYRKGKNGSPHKYIATAVEALLAAYYLDHHENFDSVVKIVRCWKKLIDETKEW